MPSPRARWLLERLTAFLLCFCVAAAIHLGQTLRAAYAEADASAATGSPLDRPVAHLHFDDAPLEKVVNEISRQSRQRIVVDWDDLADCWGELRGADTTVHVDNVTLSRALFETFRHCALSPWRIHVAPPNEVWIYTSDGGRLAKTILIHPVVRDYEVSDLLQPFSETHDSIDVQQGLFGGGGWTTIQSSERERARNDLLSLVDDQVWPRKVSTLANRLLVVAPAEDQDRIERMLQALRATLNAHPEDPKEPGSPR